MEISFSSDIWQSDNDWRPNTDLATDHDDSNCQQPLNNGKHATLFYSPRSI